jgi:hypothetical protein
MLLDASEYSSRKVVGLPALSQQTRETDSSRGMLPIDDRTEAGKTCVGPLLPAKSTTPRARNSGSNSFTVS